jgi:hypothetical protein
MEEPGLRSVGAYAVLCAIKSTRLWGARGHATAPDVVSSQVITWSVPGWMTGER